MSWSQNIKGPTVSATRWILVDQGQKYSWAPLYFECCHLCHHFSFKCDYICIPQKPPLNEVTKPAASADNPAGPEEEEEDEEESLRLLRLAALKSKKEDSISHVSNITVVFAKKRKKNILYLLRSNQIHDYIKIIKWEVINIAVK